ncbi:MAG: PH domain-containing protein [Propionicimonas sp.]
MDSLFQPPDGTWQRLAPRAAPARALATAVGSLVVLVPAVVAGWLFLPGWLGWVPWTVTGVGLVWLGWMTIRAWRWARAFGYAEREADLLITSGLWSRQLVAIPYSRMQSVQVRSGPLERLWGLSRVSLVTASIETSATIPGLEAAVATALRDRLIEAGEAQALPL